MPKVIRTQNHALKAALQNLSGYEAKVGFFETSRYDDGTPVAAVAAQNEFGLVSKGIPPRPFLRNAVSASEEKWAALAVNGSKQVLAGVQTTEKVMEGLAQVVIGDIKTSIARLFDPPLAASTIASREKKKASGHPIGSTTKPLIESKIMVNSVNRIIEKK